RGRLPDGFDAARRGAVGASDTALVLHLGPRARRRVPVARPTAADRGRSVRVPGVGVLPHRGAGSLRLVVRGRGAGGELLCRRVCAATGSGGIARRLVPPRSHGGRHGGASTRLGG